MAVEVCFNGNGLNVANATGANCGARSWRLGIGIIECQLPLLPQATDFHTDHFLILSRNYFMLLIYVIFSSSS